MNGVMMGPDDETMPFADALAIQQSGYAGQDWRRTVAIQEEQVRRFAAEQKAKPKPI